MILQPEEEQFTGNKPRHSEYILRENETRQDYIEKKWTPDRVKEFLRSNTTHGLVLLALFACIVPWVIYFLVIDLGTYKEDDIFTCSVSNAHRIQCGRSENVTIHYCDQISCCFDSDLKKCFHYVPSRYTFKEEGEMLKPSKSKTPLGNPSLPEVKFAIQEVDQNRIKMILHDPKLTFDSQNLTSNKSYTYKHFVDPLGIEVHRSDTNEMILTTSIGPTIVSENYWEWSVHLTEEYLFGLGQSVLQVKENSTLTKIIYPNSKDHNTLPIFMAYQRGKYHGLVVRHSGPLEVTVYPSNLISLKSIVGDFIELDLTLGPTPQDVIAQQRPVADVTVTPSWLLGIHSCYSGTGLSLNQMLNQSETFLSSITQGDFDSDCMHEDLLPVWMSSSQSQQELYKQRLLDLVQEMSIKGIKLGLSMPPQIPVKSAFYDTVKDDGFYKNGSNYVGRYHGLDVAYPDFASGTLTGRLVQEEIVNNLLGGTSPDYYILSNNWPSDESFNMSQSGTFPYLSQDLLEALSQTLPLDVRAQNLSQITQHLNYGASQSERILEFIPADTVFATSSHNHRTRSPIFLTDIDITWTNFRSAISTILFNSIFLNPMTSVPICGSTDNYDPKIHEKLCIRWYLMAATSPVFRVASAEPRRHPQALNTMHATDQAMKAIGLRRQLTKYFETVLGRGEPIMRPMFYDFPTDNETFPLVEQYMVGDKIMVAHPNLPDQTILSVYFPLNVGLWYGFWSGSQYKPGWISLTIVEVDWNVFIPQGTIIPLINIKADGTEVGLLIGLQGNLTASAHLTFGLKSLDFDADSEQVTIRGLDEDVLDELGCVYADPSNPDSSGTPVSVISMNIYKPDADPEFITDLQMNLCDFRGEFTILYHPASTTPSDGTASTL